MSGKIAVELGPVQETLLIPLLGRAWETKRSRGLIKDDKAVEIVDALDYDFSKWHGTPSLAGATIRTRMYDDEVKRFLKKHPEGTVVEIGVGLNTRYERLDNGRATWIDLDLPDSLELRRRFFEDTERRRMLSASVLESDWYAEVAACPEPYCFVSEAVIIYLENADAERALRGLAERFPGSLLIMDTTATAMVHSQDKHDAMKHMPKDSWFRWCCDDPAALTHWGLRLQRSLTYMDASREIRAVMPFMWRFMMLLFPWMIRNKVKDYRINRFELCEPQKSQSEPEPAP
jgi:O-methyltransferase involved in polyketide biosynthesis